MSFGPGKHSVRLVGSETEKPAMKLLGKLKKVRWWVGCGGRWAVSGEWWCAGCATIVRWSCNLSCGRRRAYRGAGLQEGG